MPEVFTGSPLSGLMDVAVHPEFANNRFVYLTYSKPVDDGSRVALARGRLEGGALSEVRDLFVGSLMVGRVERTGHLERIEFNRQGLEFRREWLLADLRRRTATSGRVPTACCTC